jgi:hypothetical protein
MNLGVCSGVCAADALNAMDAAEIRSLQKLKRRALYVAAHPMPNTD